MPAIITGAASGIGFATARRLNQDEFRRCGEGAQIALVDIDRDKLEEAAGQLSGEGADVLPLHADLADPQAPGEIVRQTMERFGGLNAIVSNAGLLRSGSLFSLSLADYELTFAVNTRPTWLFVKAAREHLRASGGSIVATASIAAHHPIPAQGAYSASKAALLMIVRQLACELGPEGIRVNSVSPGSTLTGIAGSAIDPAVLRPGGPAKNRNALGFMSRPEDQAAAICFLLGPDARFITGTDVGVDGGVRTQLMVKSGNPSEPEAETVEWTAPGLQER